jgi:RNA polymerase sigma-70 factor (ECF subfamily)
VNIQTIIDSIRAGDRGAFAALVRRYQGPLFGFLGRMGLSQGQAEELAQESFLRAWSHLGDYDARRAEFSTWLFTLARNLALNELDRAAQRHEFAAGDELPDAECPRPQPLVEMLEAERSRQLQAALRQLPPRDRSTIALAYLEELDLAAVAAIEGCSTGAVKTRLHRARGRLRQLLEADHG